MMISYVFDEIIPNCLFASLPFCGQSLRSDNGITESEEERGAERSMECMYLRLPPVRFLRQHFFW